MMAGLIVSIIVYMKMQEKPINCLKKCKNCSIMVVIKLGNAVCLI